ERLRKAGRVGKAHQDGDAVKARRIARDAVRLRVVDHLQAMLELAEKMIGLGQGRTIVAADLAGGGERRERIERAGLTQLGLSSAPDQLLRLGEKLDFADAAAAQFDVVALDRDGRAAAMRVDLPLDRVNVLDRGEIEIFAPQERPQLGEEGG